MKSVANWISRDIPDGWMDMLYRSILVALVGFIVLQLKEYVDAGAFDTAAVAVDSVLVAAGYFFVNAALRWAKS